MLGIVFLVFSLLVILVILDSMKKNLPDPLQETPDFSPDREGVKDSVYYNYVFHFSIALPDSNWRVNSNKADSTLLPFDDDQPVVGQIKEIVSFYRAGAQYNATLSIGVVSKPLQMEERDFTISLLNEMIETHPHPEQVRVITPVSAPAHRLFQGYYFVLLKAGGSNSRVLISSVLPRKAYYYILVCEIAARDYQKLKNECERIMRNFKPILST